MYSVFILGSQCMGVNHAYTCTWLGVDVPVTQYFGASTSTGSAKIFLALVLCVPDNFHAISTKLSTQVLLNFVLGCIYTMCVRVGVWSWESLCVWLGSVLSMNGCFVCLCVCVLEVYFDQHAYQPIRKMTYVCAGETFII